jgi:tetratricopeptide (TPR) repeat protein
MSQTVKSNPIRRFFAELLQRRVLQIGGAYVAGAWLGVEILTFLFDAFLAPAWAYRLMAIVLVVGFPISMVLAWVVQVNAEGHWEIDRSRGDARTLAAAIVIGLLVTAVLAWQILPQRDPLPVFEPMPASLAILMSTTPGTALEQQERLYQSLSGGLERTAGLTWVQANKLEYSGDPVSRGRELEVAFLGVFNVKPTPSEKRIGIRLLDVFADEIIWEDTFALDADMLPETAHGIANELLEKMVLQAVDAQQFYGTVNAVAYEAYLEGRVLATVPGELNSAIEDFQAAIDLDPGYVLAYVGLAQALLDQLENGNLKNEERTALEKRAQRAVDMARRIDPHSAAAMSLFALWLDNPQLRYQAWERALELEPDHAMSLFRYAAELRENGLLEDAERLARQAIRLRPADARFQSELATIREMRTREQETGSSN